MSYRPHIIGGSVGFFAALLVLSGLGRHAVPHETGRLISECGGPLRELVIHFVAGDRSALPVYRQFLPELASGVVVHVVCPDPESFDQLRAGIGPVACRLSPVVVDHPISVWSRDRWVALAPAGKPALIRLLAPADEDGAAIWPQRQGDAKVAADIARLMSDRLESQKLPLLFDGGDFLADEFTVFATPAVAAKNVASGFREPGALQEFLASQFGKPVVMLETAPDHHAGMYMMAAGSKTMLVGDPRMAMAMYDSELPFVPDGVDRSSETQSRFDAVADQLSRLGYRIVRIPTLPSTNGKTYLTYVNVITEQREGRNIVYMPTYPQAPEMNALASQIWEGLGYEVHPIDCSSCYADFGTLHCLVNVLRRG